MPIDGIVRAVNLIPPDMHGAVKAPADQGPRRESTGGAGPFVVLGVLAACVAGAAGYVLTDNTIKQRQSDLASVTARQQAISAKANELRPFADFATKANAQVATVTDLAGSRFNWDQVLIDVSRAIPADVTLKTLSGNVSTDTGGSGASSSLRSSVSAPAVTLDGCAPGQTQVAQLMARLRDVDGVTRVSLGKSDTQTVSASSGTGADTSATAARNAAPCGTGARPSFEVVMFFEGSSAAASAPGAATSSAGTPSASATATPGATPTASPTPAGGSTAASTTAASGGTAP
jgi:Tfp pilus assembly protein PilN